MTPTVNGPSGSATEASAIEDAGRVRSALSPYQMHIIREPPIEVRPGNTLIPPVRVALRTQETGARAIDLNSYWASVSLISADGLVALAPPSTTLLSGSLVDSIREPGSAENESGIGYALFQNLVINQPGNFRLRISLLRMPSGISDAGNTAGGLLPSSGVLNTGSVTTRVIHVHRDAPMTA
ncbi:MAG: hypothetical protein LQ346_008681 [Caloplaca aetnensis]|nr:MAG: hypothetical protein LQ346_008681 [Caloplaca aetnensis]